MTSRWSAINGFNTNINIKMSLKPHRSWYAGQKEHESQFNVAQEHRNRVESLIEVTHNKPEPKLPAVSIDLNDPNKLVQAIHSVDIGADIVATACENAPQNSSPQTTTQAPAPRIASPNTARQNAPINTAIQNTPPAVLHE